MESRAVEVRTHPFGRVLGRGEGARRVPTQPRFTDPELEALMAEGRHADARNYLRERAWREAPEPGLYLEAIRAEAAIDPAGEALHGWIARAIVARLDVIAPLGEILDDAALAAFGAATRPPWSGLRVSEPRAARRLLALTLEHLLLDGDVAGALAVASERTLLQDARGDAELRSLVLGVLGVAGWTERERVTELMVELGESPDAVGDDDTGLPAWIAEVLRVGYLLERIPQGRCPAALQRLLHLGPVFGGAARQALWAECAAELAAEPGAYLAYFDALFEHAPELAEWTAVSVSELGAGTGAGARSSDAHADADAGDDALPDLQATLDRCERALRTDRTRVVWWAALGLALAFTAAAVAWFGIWGGLGLLLTAPLLAMRGPLRTLRYERNVREPLLAALARHGWPWPGLLAAAAERPRLERHLHALGSDRALSAVALLAHSCRDTSRGEV
ncbi:MAG: hypothetical protein PVI30_09970 [Myxococcales bacterium]|jgi:hypothetical protein